MQNWLAKSLAVATLSIGLSTSLAAQSTDKHIRVTLVGTGGPEINPTRLFRGAGVGAMLVTPFGPIGLDYAYGFDKTRPSWQLHFKFGQGF